MTKRLERVRRLALDMLLALEVLVEGAVKVAPPAMHQEIARRLLRLDVTRLCLVAPRGHAKSTLISVGFVLWHLFLEDIYRSTQGLPRRTVSGRKEASYVLLIAKTQSDAIKRLRTIKTALEQSALLRKLFGDFGPKTAIKWRDDIIILKDGSVVQCVGTGQNVHGLNEGNVRPTLILVDDPENEQNTKTNESMQANIRWLFQAIMPSLDPRVGRLVVVGTPINASCMVVNLHKSFSLAGAADSDSIWFQNDLARNMSRWSAPAEEECDEEDDTGRWLIKQGLLWPGWISASRLASEKKRCANTPGVGLGVYYRMWECVVVGDEEQVFTPDLFVNSWMGDLRKDEGGMPYLHLTHLRGARLPKARSIPVVISMGCDPAFTTSARADRTAVALLATDAEDNVYELEGIYKKLLPFDMLQTIAAKYKQTRPETAIIEANGPQAYIAEDLWHSYGIAMLRDRPRTHKKGVGGRIERLHPHMKRGKFFHRVGSPLRTELLSYPRGRDDYADATEKAFRVRRPAHHTVLGEAPKSRLRRFDPMTA